MDFFRLFFTVELLSQICEQTNSNGRMTIEGKPSFGDEDGTWKETSPEEIEKLIALILYSGLVEVSHSDLYWSTTSLYHGLWARSIMSRERFNALMSMLHVVDSCAEGKQDKLHKVIAFLQFFKGKCKSLYQPFQQLAVDERMIKSRQHTGTSQYQKNKPTKSGIKMWVLMDSANGYTYDFHVCIGKNAAERPGANRLGYDVVMRLVQPLINQGYHLYCDNFCTSVKLMKDLFRLMIPATGAVAEKHRGIPNALKKGKQWANTERRGSLRWVRDDVCLVLQWKDNRPPPVTMLTSIDSANDFVLVDRKEKVGNVRQHVKIKQPNAVHNYNQHMNAVYRSDEILAENDVLRVYMQWWQTLFFHVIDIAVVNSYVLFQLHRAENPDAEGLKRPGEFSIFEYREELVCQLSGLEEYAQPPLSEASEPPSVQPQPGAFATVHVPEISDGRKSCKVCYATTKEEFKVNTYCSAPQCQVYLHCTQEKNCFAVWHSKDYPH